MFKMKLSEFATLQTGLVLKRKEAHCIEKTEMVYQRLTMRALNEYGSVDVNELEVFPSTMSLEPSVLTHENDIIVKLFTPIYPTLVTEDTEGLVIPSQLLVIRVDDERVYPDYVRYYLSTPEISEYMLSIEGWRSQRTIKVGTFADLEIPIPPIDKQKLIAEMFNSDLKRKSLYRELIEEQSKLTSLEIQKYIGG